MFSFLEKLMEKLVESESSEQKYTFEVQAKTEEGGDDEWLTMGDIQHVKAAEELAKMYDYDGIILTKNKNTPTIWKHRVSKRVVFDVVPLRQGS